MSYSPLLTGIPVIARSTGLRATNATGGNLLKGTAIRMTPTGALLVDVSVEDSANAIAGIVKTNFSGGSVGEVVSSGIIEDITTPYVVGTVLYIAKDGSLTDSKPTFGVNGFTFGDWVIRVGVVGKNITNPLMKDLLVNISIVGQL